MAVQLLRRLVRGEAYAVLLTLPDFDLAATAAYLLLTNADGGGNRLRLQYDPATPAENDGVLEDHNGTPKVAFRLSAERTRDAAFVPAGRYAVHLHVGPLTGTENWGERVCYVAVCDLEDGGPVS